MKVLQIASGDLWGGAEAQVNTLCKYLAREDGVEVHVVLLNHGELEQRLKENEVPVSVFDESNMSFVELLLRLKVYLKQLKPDVIHTHRQKENILGSIANLLSVRAKCVRTQHGAPEFEYSWVQWQKKIQQIADTACGKYLQSKVVAVSSELAYKIQNTFPSNHICVIENGVDQEVLYTVKADAPFKLENPNAIHVGIVGRLVPVKRVDLFLEMARELVDQSQTSSNYKFHVIGDGPLRSELANQADQIGVSGQVTFHGHTADVASYIKSLDLLVMCSDHEGLPMTLLEAMVLGTPIVSHNAGALVPTFERGLGGGLANAHSAEAYANCVNDVLLKRIDLAPINDENFSFLAEENAQRLLNLYNKIGSSPKGL